MSKEKQIDEMSAKIFYCPIAFISQSKADGIAEHLYNAGYRKKSEVARAFFEELDYYIALYKKGDFSDKSLIEYIDELKKKYTEETDIENG